LSKNEELLENPLEIIKESKVEAPFGKRFYDQPLLKHIKGIDFLKFWGSLIANLTMSLLFVFSSSDRIEKFTDKPVDFNKTTATISSNGDKLIIPELVLDYKKPEPQKDWSKMIITPIKVVSFNGDKKIPPGSESKATLLTGATNGLIKARLTENLKVDGVTYLDAGTLLLGQGRSTEERLFIQFKKAVFRDGKSIPISAQAYDASDSIVGLIGSRVGDIGLKMAASSGLHFIAGMSSGMETPQDPMHPRKPTTDEAAMNGLSEAAAEQAKIYMDEIKQKPPIIEVKAGTNFIVTFDGGNE
jgi:hypothetical protein